MVDNSSSPSGADDDHSDDERQLDIRFRRAFFGFTTLHESLYQPLEHAWQAGETAAVDALVAGLTCLPVFDALLDQATMPSMTEPEATRERVEHFLGEAVRGTRAEHAYPKAFLARMLENQDPLEAELMYKSALLLDDTCFPARDQLAIMSIDRGDYESAVRHLQADRDAETSRLIAALRAGAAASSDVGRNEPCPCGSGKKFKTCHIGKPLPGSETAFRLADRVALYITEVAADDLDEVAAIARFDEADAFIQDLVMFEGGLLDEYLVRRGPLLSAEDRQELERWVETERAVHEVTSHEPGVSLSLRRVDTGDTVTVAERSVSTQVVSGTYLLCRTTSDGHPAVVGNVLELSLGEVKRAIQLVDTHAGEHQWAEWYGSLFDPPVVRNSDGHIMAPMRIDFDVPSSEVEVRAWLDSLADRNHAGQWALSGSIDDDNIVDATLTLEASTASSTNMSAEVNSEERADRIIEMVETQFPAAVVAGIESADVSAIWASIDASSGVDHGVGEQASSPDTDQFVAEHLADYYTQWLDMELPALRGMSPRQAAGDPTMIGDLRRLLNSLTGGPGFDAEAIADALGIDL